MSRRRRWLAGGLAAAGLLLAAVALNTLAHYEGWGIARLAPEALSAKLAPFYRVTKPAGTGPFPTALLYSGCDGPHDNLDRWASMLNAHGWAAIVVDSHGPRGLGGEAWRLVCAGQVLMGSERAGDVLVSLADARRMPFVDPERMVLIGASHGGWAIMDLFALDPPRRLPFNLAALPPGPEDPLDGVIGTILLYPYCGEASRSGRDGWGRRIPALFLLSADDRVAPAGRCIAVAERLAADGVPVETRLFEGVTHAFDQQERSEFSTLAFDAAATAQALAAGAAFLDRVAGQ
ncbi:MAG: dienelactone hydrolase family protein [Amaricoccus sp.]